MSRFFRFATCSKCEPDGYLLIPAVPVPNNENYFIHPIIGCFRCERQLSGLGVVEE